jgi:hypothetical protein
VNILKSFPGVRIVGLLNQAKSLTECVIDIFRDIPEATYVICQRVSILQVPADALELLASETIGKVNERIAKWHVNGDKKESDPIESVSSVGFTLSCLVSAVIDGTSVPPSHLDLMTGGTFMLRKMDPNELQESKILFDAPFSHLDLIKDSKFVLRKIDRSQWLFHLRSPRWKRTRVS